MAEKSPFSNVGHVGIVVRDIDKAAEYYESLGLGPFKPFKSMDFLEKRLLGKPIDPDSIKLGVRIGKLDPIEAELLQPVKGEGPWKEFLGSKGEGIQHLAFYVDDIEKEEARLVEKGLKVLYRSRMKNGGGATYFDTREVGGVIIELTQWAPGMLPD